MNALKQAGCLVASILSIFSLWAFPATAASPKPRTLADLAVYKGDDRQQILEEGEGAEIHKKAGYNPTRKDVAGAATYKKFYGADSVDELGKRDELFQRLFLKT